MISYSYVSRISGTTYFKKPINFQFYLKYQRDWTFFQNRQSSVNNYFANITATYKINENWLASATANSFNLNNNFQNFINGSLNYNPVKGKFNYKLQFINLANQSTFDILQINDFQSYSSKTRIIPRYIMLSATMRF
ncbi:hypothetical protein [Polaribacter tangerinus]|uniref:hypothetical protein n=1 Tax=Polaribacter tangerinus TaxID=1920034 RepID=UPI000B4AF997|nr:hypothetical protein [Polaribacter tangerinus]